MEGMASGILHLLSGDWGKLLGDFGKMEVINPPYLKWDWDNNKGWLPMTQDDFNEAFVGTMQVRGEARRFSVNQHVRVVLTESRAREVEKHMFVKLHVQE